MTTPAEHAATVREALSLCKDPLAAGRAVAALDALIAQAETAERLQRLLDDQTTAAMTAESERDHARTVADQRLTEGVRIRAERDHARAALQWVNETWPKVMREMPTELFQPLRVALGDKP